MRKISPKAWTFSIIGFLVVLVIINAVIWHFFTRDVLTFEPYYNGGLDRLGYIIGSKHYRKPESTLPQKHFESAEYRGGPVDVISIGDSFSNMTDNGKDPLYQDWIASLYDLNIMNIRALPNSYELQTVIILLNSGWLDKIKPRYLVLETVESHCMSKNVLNIDFNAVRPLAEIEAYYQTANLRQRYPEYGFLNSGNFKFLLYSFLYNFSDRAFISKVHIRELDRPFFSAKKDRQLLFYYEDVTKIPYATAETVGRMNDNLNRLSALLKKKGIILYFMPVVDKYNLYSDYILNNPHPKSVFFELLRRESRDYVLVDTKAVLKELIEKGEKDVYYSDDTHWSWKASRRIAQSLRFSPPAGH